jgi:uncharacterized protein (TIGR02594 family)
MSEILNDMLSNYGLASVAGIQHNPKVIAMFHDIGFKWVNDDETAWCSAAMNYFAKKHGYERSGKLDARSWLKVGEQIDKPLLGDVVVFWRESKESWKGHVGLYINHDDKYIYCLGGNQSGSIRITPYPVERLLGYRRLKKI